MEKYVINSPLSMRFDRSMRHILTHSPERLIVALSGGLDSVALTRLLCEWRKKTGCSIPLAAAHVHHGLRGEAADEDEVFCRDVAADLGMNYTSGKFDAEAIAANERIGIEEAGRRIRYRFFHELAGQDGLVLTGHHANDQVETILLNLRRGAHARGLAGMRDISEVRVPPGIGVRVGRPLLAIFRDELRMMAEEGNWQWREDATNADTVFTRNRLRLRTIPGLERLMPGFCRRLLARAKTFREENETYSAKARELVSGLCRDEDGGIFFAVDSELVATAETEVIRYAVRDIAESMLDGRVSSGRGIERVIELIASGKMNEAVVLPGGLHVRREREGVFFFLERIGKEETFKEEVLRLPEPPFEIKGCGVAIAAEWVPDGVTMPDDDKYDNTVQWFNGDAIVFPLCFRAPFPGERFRWLGAPGRRKIHDLLIDVKVPRRQRNAPRVLADAKGALWVWPYRMAERVRLKDHCGAVLRVRIESIHKDYNEVMQIPE